MRTSRTTLAAMLSLALAIVPAAAVAQAADGEPATPSYFTSTETRLPDFQVPAGEFGSNSFGYRSTVGLKVVAEADDPRASGDITAIFTYDMSYNGDIGRGTGLARLVNEGGTFEGPLHVVYYPDGSEFRMAMLEGQDGYEGLTYVMTNFLDPSGNGKPQGLIWEGDPPALPDADALPE